MASISTDADGKRRILFVNPNGDRKQIRLGRMPMKAVQAINAKVENLLAAAVAGHAIDNDTAAWVGSRDRRLYDKLAAVGLIPQRQKATLAAFLDSYIAARAT